MSIASKMNKQTSINRGRWKQGRGKKLRLEESDPHACQSIESSAEVGKGEMR